MRSALCQCQRALALGRSALILSSGRRCGEGNRASGLRRQVITDHFAGGSVAAAYRRTYTAAASPAVPPAPNAEAASPAVPPAPDTASASPAVPPAPDTASASPSVPPAPDTASASPAVPQASKREKIRLDDTTKEILSAVPNLLARIEELMEYLPGIEVLPMIHKAPAIVDAPWADITRRREALRHVFPEHDTDLWIEARPQLLMDDNNTRNVLEKLALIDNEFPGLGVIKIIDTHPRILTASNSAFPRLSGILRTEFPNVPPQLIVKASPIILTRNTKAVQDRICLLRHQTSKLKVDLNEAIEAVPALLWEAAHRLERYAYIKHHHPTHDIAESVLLPPYKFESKYGYKWKKVLEETLTGK